MNPSKRKFTPVVCGVSAKMSKQQLEEHIIQLREELDREREQCQCFQLQRDEMHILCENTKRELEDKKAELRNKDRELKEVEEGHEAEIRVYKQKVKQLLYEQQKNITALKTEGMVSTGVLDKEHESMLRTDVRSLKADQKDQVFSNENYIKNLKLSHEEEIKKLRMKFEEKVQEIKVRYETRLQKQQQVQHVRHKKEIHELEQRKSADIKALTADHEKAISDLKKCHSDVILVSSDHIDCLKEQLADLKKKHESLEKDSAELRQQNNRLTESLQKSEQEASDLQKQLCCSKKLQDDLVKTKARLKVSASEVKSLKWENQVLEQGFRKAEQERAELYQGFIKAIEDVQQRSRIKNLRLEKKMNALTETLEKSNAQLHRVAASVNQEPSAQNVLDPKPEEQLQADLKRKDEVSEKGSAKQTPLTQHNKTETCPPQRPDTQTQEEQ